VNEPEKLPPNGRRAQWRSAMRRDASRHGRRLSGHTTFWRYLALIGSVGWPIAIAAVGGIWLGRIADANAGGGNRFTVLLLAVGLALGSWTAWKMVSGERP
jgi:predicted F0F1-ATPase subunit